MKIPKRDRSVGYLVWKLSNLNRGYLEARLNEIDLHVAQMGALVALHETPSASTADLARDMHMTPQNLSLMMTRFSEEGWVQRNPHRTHGRIQHLELTPPGRRKMEDGVARAAGLDQTMQAQFTAAEREVLPRLLRKCLATMEAEVCGEARSRSKPRGSKSRAHSGGR
jgi:DNA-binding MarR family transcriptional regulator